jgi:hypothetical protein
MSLKSLTTVLLAILFVASFGTTNGFSVDLHLSERLFSILSKQQRNTNEHLYTERSGADIPVVRRDSENNDEGTVSTGPWAPGELLEGLPVVSASNIKTGTISVDPPAEEQGDVEQQNIEPSPPKEGKGPAPPKEEGKGPSPPKEEGKGPSPPKEDGEGPAPPKDEGEGPAPPKDKGEGPAPPKEEGEGPSPPKEEGEGPSPPKEDGEGPAPPKDEGEGPAPPKDEGEGPAPPKDEGEVPAPPKKEGEVPAPPKDEGEGPAPPKEEGKGPSPPKEEGKGPSPPKEDGEGPAPPKDAGEGPAPPKDEGEGPAPPKDKGEGPAPPKEEGKGPQPEKSQEEPTGENEGDAPDTELSDSPSLSPSTNTNGSSDMPSLSPMSADVETAPEGGMNSGGTMNADGMMNAARSGKKIIKSDIDISIDTDANTPTLSSKGYSGDSNNQHGPTTMSMNKNGAININKNSSPKSNTAKDNIVYVTKSTKMNKYIRQRR